MPTNQDLLAILQSGVLAPSADNQHVFRFEVEKDAIGLWPSPEFASTTERHRRILGMLSVGAVLENMSLRAGELGFSTFVHGLLANSNMSAQIARLTFQPATPSFGDLSTAIPMRHTNRRMYCGPALSASEAALLECEVPESKEVRLIWLHGDARRRVLWLIWRAESERFRRERLHHEIFSSIRFDLSWQESAEWALPPGALEIEAPMRPLFKALRHWPLMRTLSRIGVHHLVGLRAGWLPCWQAPGLAILATSSASELSAVSVGRVFERIWLRASSLNLAIQPLAASTVLPLQATDDNGASDILRAKLNSGWREIVPDAIPLMLFRIGRAKRPIVISRRKALQEYRHIPRYCERATVIEPKDPQRHDVVGVTAR